MLPSQTPREITVSYTHLDVYKRQSLNNSTMSVHDVLLMARYLKMERRGNNWNLKNARKRDLQILERMGFKPKLMVSDIRNACISVKT